VLKEASFEKSGDDALSRSFDAPRPFLIAVPNEREKHRACSNPNEKKRLAKAKSRDDMRD